MSLDWELYRETTAAVTGGKSLSPALDAYARAWFSEPPLSGEWTRQTMYDELWAILWNYSEGGIDLRRRSAESILRERLLMARTRIEQMECSLLMGSDEIGKMRSFIARFHLDALYKDFLEEPRTEACHAGPSGEEELPFAFDPFSYGPDLPPDTEGPV